MQPNSATPENRRVLTLDEAKQMFLDARREDVTHETLRSDEQSVRYFIEYVTAEHDIEYVHEVDGFLIEKWKLARMNEVTKVTVSNNLKELRKYVRYCESINALDRGLADAMVLPKVTREEQVNDEFVEPSLATRLLDYYEATDRNGDEHARFALMWHTGCRISGAHALDVQDYQYDDATGYHYLSFRHRPETGTALKNKQKSERDVAIHDPGVARILDNYIEYKRLRVTDDHGREPLFTSPQSKRLSRQKAYKQMKRRTRPCKLGLDCPLGREPDACPAFAAKRAHECDPAYGNHPIRKGAITYQLACGVPKHIVSERCDVSIEVLEKHYDKRTEKIKMQTRLQSENPFGRLSNTSSAVPGNEDPRFAFD